MKAIFIIVLSMFAVYGVFAAVLRAVGCCREGGEKCLIVKIKSSSDDVEVQIRTLLKKYPDCEIVIVDDGLKDEARNVAEKLCDDYENIRLIKTVREI